VSRRVYDGGAVVAEWDDDTRTYRRWDGDALVEERPYNEAETAPLDEAENCVARESAQVTLLGKVDAAIAADLTYLDSAVPILAIDRLARVEGQVARLTRQTVALLRLVGARLDDTSGS